ncbi:MAG: shikimate kinase [Acidobacteriaceae bacterium]
MSAPRTTRRVVLTGFMGAGKSTIGALLAQRLGWEFVDVDSAIESRAGKTVAEIFSQEGEAAFRPLEMDAIRDHTSREFLVLALGGGAIEAESTRRLLAGLKRTLVIFLEAPLEVLVARCLAQANAAERPVLADREGLLLRFNSRLGHYRNAHLTVATGGLSPEDVVDRILIDLK